MGPKMKKNNILVYLMLLLGSLSLACRFGSGSSSLDIELRGLLDESGVTYSSFAPGPPAEEAMIRLGEALFFDKILSGNRDTSCATCHHPLMHTSDDLSLPIGTGGHGLGTERVMGTDRNFVPRNSPDVFNRAAPEWVTMFWDGRITGSPEMGYANPAGMMLPHGLNNVLAVQAMFPPTSIDEMRGNDDDVTAADNELANLPDDDPVAIWDGLMARLMNIPEYVTLFRNAYPHLSKNELGFQHAANAIAAYEADTWTFNDAPWDLYLAGDDDALTSDAKRGATLFYDKAQCVVCHSTNLFTDQEYHNIAVPQLGPGKDADKPLDFGRWHVTNNPQDKFAFRTPPLRNVTLTFPYMHNGAYPDLEAAVRHQLNPTAALQDYDPENLRTELQKTCQVDESTIQAILETLDPLAKAPIDLNDSEVADLMAFLEALTSPSAVDLSNNIPEFVPSGLPVLDD
jgi:cytochrome c peroxidase